MSLARKQKALPSAIQMQGGICKSNHDSVLYVIFCKRPPCVKFHVQFSFVLQLHLLGLTLQFISNVSGDGWAEQNLDKSSIAVSALQDQELGINMINIVTKFSQVLFPNKMAFLFSKGQVQIE